ncbi:MAG: YsnF/AvaK domain-containing protein [Janthinobacterium lividum]
MTVEPEKASGDRAASTSVETIELLEEILHVSKRTVETGRVKVSVLTETEQRLVTETLHSRHVEVERHTLGRQLQPGETMPASRLEGDLLIVPIVEEVLVVEKRLVLTEELRIRVVRHDEPVTRTIPLRRQKAVIEHGSAANDDAVAP